MRSKCCPDIAPARQAHQYILGYARLMQQAVPPHARSAVSVPPAWQSPHCRRQAPPRPGRERLPTGNSRAKCTQTRPRPRQPSRFSSPVGSGHWLHLAKHLARAGCVIAQEIDRLADFGDAVIESLAGFIESSAMNRSRRSSSRSAALSRAAARRPGFRAGPALEPFQSRFHGLVDVLLDRLKRTVPTTLEGSDGDAMSCTLHTLQPRRQRACLDTLGRRAFHPFNQRFKLEPVAEFDAARIRTVRIDRQRQRNLTVAGGLPLAQAQLRIRSFNRRFSNEIFRSPATATKEEFAPFSSRRRTR
jgi:hypothetical protein